MGLFEKIFNKQEIKFKSDGAFQLLNGYVPIFSAWNGQIYDSEIVRSAIDARARHISKLRVEIYGSANPPLRNKLKHAPNEWQTWSQFLYRLSTILDNTNTAFIVPVIDEYGITTGVYPILPQTFQLVQYQDKPFIRFQLANGKFASIELERVGIMTKFQFDSDFFGATNNALRPTMELLHIQNQGITEGVKSSATYRFMATLNNFATDEDIAKERARFNEKNLKQGGGVLLFPNTYKDIKQISSSPYVADANQMKIIQDKVYSYFGVNEDVLENKAYGDSWSAFYEGAIEPFAIQFSEVLTKMLFTLRERTEGNEVVASSSRVQYMSTRDKLNFVQGMLDRGIISRNEGRDVFNLPLLQGEGDEYIIRGEYWNASDKLESEGENGNQQDNGQDN